MTATIEEEPTSARDALLAYLTTADGPVSNPELVKMTGLADGTVRVALHRMLAAGQVFSPARGRWTLATPETALAVREPDAVIPPGLRRNNGPQIDGARVLSAMADQYVPHFVRFSSVAPQVAVTLWAAHAHLRDKDGRLETDASPRLVILSDKPASGKTTVLEILNLLCPRTDGLVIEPTEAAFRSMMADEKLTMLLDEADVLFGSGKRKEAIRAAINAGYTRNGKVRYMDHRQVVKANVFGPVAIAGLDVLEKSTGGMLAAILSRSIIIRMQPPSAGVSVPDITSSAKGQESGLQGRKLLELWVQANRDAILTCEPELPDGVRLRAAQIWRPLLQIAEVAGGTWPARARAACAELATATPEAPKDETDELAGDFFSGLNDLDD